MKVITFKYKRNQILTSLNKCTENSKSITKNNQFFLEIFQIKQSIKVTFKFKLKAHQI